MRVLVLGGNGMLGHKLVAVLGGRFETWSTVRDEAVTGGLPGFNPRLGIAGVDVRHWDSLADSLKRANPDVVINAVGIVKQLKEASEAVPTIEVNSLLPHKLARWCQEEGARLIHISTDCVFSGSKGSYLESDTPDATDLYGRSKLLGEVNSAGCLTLRTSIVGREIRSKHGILEWFLSQDGSSVKGFTNAYFSGVPTSVLARLIGDLIEDYPDLDGLFHVSTDRISKFALLSLFREAFSIDCTVIPADEPRIDRSLDSSAFQERTGILLPQWSQLVHELAEDSV